MKQTDKYLMMVFEHVQTMDHAKKLLEKIYTDLSAAQSIEN